MSLKSFFTRSGIKDFLSRLRIGGYTLFQTLTENRKNTSDMFYDIFDQMLRTDQPLDVAVQEFGKVAQRRKRQTLMTLRNIMSAVRGQGRAVLATGSGQWVNRGILDGNTTDVCIRHTGRTWRMPYKDIPNKPPRVPPVHPCRSFLQWVRDDEPAPDDRPFMVQFNASEELQRELLGKTRFEAFKRGDLKIRSYAEFEFAILTTLVALGLAATNEEEEEEK